MPIVPQNAATTPAKNRLKRPSAWQTPSNCRHFHDNLYQIQFSDCSALPESRLQSLPHPYSPLRASAFFRISRNPGPGKLSIYQKSFGMNLVQNQTVTVQNGTKMSRNHELACRYDVMLDVVLWSKFYADWSCKSSWKYKRLCVHSSI